MKTLGQYSCGPPCQLLGEHDALHLKNLGSDFSFEGLSASKVLGGA